MFQWLVVTYLLLLSTFIYFSCCCWCSHVLCAVVAFLPSPTCCALCQARTGRHTLTSRDRPPILRETLGGSKLLCYYSFRLFLLHVGAWHLNNEVTLNRLIWIATRVTWRARKGRTIMPTQTATPSSCQETKNSSSTNNSCRQQKRDELTTSAVTGEVEEEKKAEENEGQVGTGGDQKEGHTTGFMQSDMLTFKRQDIPQDEARDTSKIFKKSPQYVPVYRPNPERGSSAFQDRVKPGSGSHPRRPSTGVIYAELQLPRASNNGSMRRGEQRRPKTQYAEITFQGHPLQTADI